MTNKHDPAQIKLAHQRNQIRRMTIERMRVLPRWLGGQAKANHIGNDDAPTGIHDRTDHVAIEETPCGIAMQEHHRVALRFVNIMHAPAIDVRVVRSVGPLATKRLRYRVFPIYRHDPSSDIGRTPLRLFTTHCDWMARYRAIAL